MSPSKKRSDEGAEYYSYGLNDKEINEYLASDDEWELLKVRAVGPWSKVVPDCYAEHLEAHVFEPDQEKK